MLRRRILDGSFAPGERLIEVELAAGLQISRTPLREALRGLAQEGIVSHRPNKGFHVPDITGEEAAALYELRTAIETEAARLAAVRRADSELESMYACLASAKSIIESGSQAPYPKDLDFHRLVFDASHSSLIEQRGLEISRRLQLFRQRGGYSNERARVAHDEHQAIADGIAARAPEDAAAAMRKHLEGSLTRALDASPAS